MKKNFVASLFVVSTVIGLSGCQTLDMSSLSSANGLVYPHIEKKAINTETVNYKLVQGSKRQTKNKVSITLEPVVIEEGDIYHRVSVKPLFTLLTVDGQKNYEVTYSPVVSQDERLRFNLKVSNSSSRVLRPSGAVLTFGVDGSSTSVRSDNYQELLNMMIVPNSNTEIVVAGPKLSELKKDKGVMAIDLYEVKVGDKLSNYSWILEYEKKGATLNTIIKKEKITVTNDEARSLHGKLVVLDNIAGQ
ncbi:hypothetical protein [Psychromonas antarctica]|uniref:hypothetical protein n=1 Tax=Psychromonas antarctica TaxID=67573 RepID=UPI001EE98C11|nr:hypothetical protein [Psychromonas antarctica]MCG6201063.1 hypothetical protein [Psychromonas antarctica]